MQNDAVLVEQTLAGDEQAFHRLIILYQADIHAFVMSWIKNPDDVKELVQEIFLEAYRDIGSLRNPERFYFWLRQIAKHRCQNWHERKNQDRFVPLSDDIIAKIPSAEESLILRETLAKVMQAINELPETEKNILQERYLDDLSYNELQAKHGLSYKALSMRLLRAKQKVRARVEKLLAGVSIFSWQDALKKMLLGGMEAVKIGAKAKIITIGVATVLIIGGGVFIGFLKLNYQHSQKDILLSDQTKQEISAKTYKADQKISEMDTQKKIGSPSKPSPNMGLSDNDKIKANPRMDSSSNLIASNTSNINDTKKDQLAEANSPQNQTADTQATIDSITQELNTKLSEYKNLKPKALELMKLPQTSEVVAQLNSLNERRLELAGISKTPGSIPCLLSWYYVYTKDKSAFEPGGWVNAFGVIDVKISLNENGTPSLTAFFLPPSD